MRLERLRNFALSLPHATVVKQWGENLVFKIGGKLFLILSLDGDTLERAAFKCTPGDFKRLSSLDGIVPAPYLARASWVAVEDFAALSEAELQRLIRDSHSLVLSTLPRKIRATLR